jgi:hypothetical protein
MSDGPDGVRDEELAERRRRADRKRARLAKPAPAREPRYVDVELSDLRRMRAALAEEEMRVSYWRRIFQARLDVLHSEHPVTADVSDLSRVLADAPTAHRRLANISLALFDDVAPLPDLAELWARQIDRTNPVATKALEAELAGAEHRLSEHRRQLHIAIDAVTCELIARYREDPMLALGALPPERRKSAG